MGGTQEHLQSYLTEDHECMWQIICHFCKVLTKLKWEKRTSTRRKMTSHGKKGQLVHSLTNRWQIRFAVYCGWCRQRYV